MSCYNYTHFIKEFADRTTENLQIVERFSFEPEKKEVTQLINSLLGLLVVPSERYKENSSEKEREESTLRASSPEMYRNIKKTDYSVEEGEKTI